MTSATPTNIAINSIFTERVEQMKKHRWSEDHDDTHSDGELVIAAVCYASPIKLFTYHHSSGGKMFMDPWPWDGLSVDAKNGKKRRRQLVIAGALIVAEIERLDRQRQIKKGVEPDA